MLDTTQYAYETLEQFVGTDFGATPPVSFGQNVIDAFADCTGDHQWIHVDPKRAAKDGPFGTTIAHGFLTLSVLAATVQQAGVIPADAKAVINYGIESVRFLAPVPSGSEVVSSFRLVGVEPRGDSGKLMKVAAELRVEGAAKPALNATLLALIVG